MALVALSLIGSTKTWILEPRARNKGALYGHNSEEKTLNFCTFYLKNAKPQNKREHRPIIMFVTSLLMFFIIFCYFVIKHLIKSNFELMNLWSMQKGFRVFFSESLYTSLLKARILRCLDTISTDADEIFRPLQCEHIKWLSLYQISDTPTIVICGRERKNCNLRVGEAYKTYFSYFEKK